MHDLAGGDNKTKGGDWFGSDDSFDGIYPADIQLLASRHWTPLRVTRKIVDFLAPDDGVRVLDVGSGVGKFCLMAAHQKPGADFFGVEQRKGLIRHAENARRILQMNNVHFLQMNMVDLSFNSFDHFYFYNAFYENLFDTPIIDDTIKRSPGLYNFYTRNLRRKLEGMRSGTRFVTFHCIEGRPPAGYQLIGEEEDGMLKYWIKA